MCPGWRCEGLEALLRAAIDSLAAGWDIGVCSQLPFFLPLVLLLKQGDNFPTPSSVQFVSEGRRWDSLFFFCHWVRRVLLGGEFKAMCRGGTWELFSP